MGQEFEDKFETKLDDLRNCQNEHEKEFVQFRAVSDERFKTLNSNMEEIKELLKQHFAESTDHENAQALMIQDLNNRLTTLEVEKRTERRFAVMLSGAISTAIVVIATVVVPFVSKWISGA